jgi:hypothetical protein
MSESKMIEVAKELLQRARVGKVDWEKTSSNDLLRVKFPDVELRIYRSANIYTLALLNQAGTEVDNIIALPSRDAPTHAILQEIFNLARNQILDVESNINKVLDYLKES